MQGNVFVEEEEEAGCDVENPSEGESRFTLGETEDHESPAEGGADDRDGKVGGLGKEEKEGVAKKGESKSKRPKKEEGEGGLDSDCPPDNDLSERRQSIAGLGVRRNPRRRRDWPSVRGPCSCPDRFPSFN